MHREISEWDERPQPRLGTNNLTDHLIQRAILEAPTLGGATTQRIDGWELDLDGREHERFCLELVAALGRRGWTLRADVRGQGSAELVLHDPAGRALHARIDTEDAIACAFAGNAADAEATLRVFGVFVRRLARMSRRGDQVPVRVWSMNGSGPTSRMTLLRCPRWSEISANYPRVSQRLEWLMRLERPAELGHIVFWHGPSGTGKTWAVRALIREWRSMQIEIVSDPEAFLEQPHLVNELLLEPPHRPGDKRHGRASRASGRLLVFEDTPELQLGEAGSGLRGTLSKLLNATDGLLDAAVPTVILATTHEPLPEIESALVRPGRCLQVEHFPLLDAREAALWLSTHGGAGSAPRGQSSLAELYAHLRGDGVRGPARREPMGFRPRGS